MTKLNKKYLSVHQIPASSGQNDTGQATQQSPSLGAPPTLGTAFTFFLNKSTFTLLMPLPNFILLGNESMNLEATVQGGFDD